MRSWFGKCSETLDKINSTIYFDLRLYRCLDLADLYASTHILADGCLEILQRVIEDTVKTNPENMAEKKLKQTSTLSSSRAGWALSPSFLAGDQLLCSALLGNLSYHFTTQIIRLDIKGTFIDCPPLLK